MATIKSIEEKAKAYDEALKKAKDMLSYKEVRQEDIEYLFPELKESEDEKIKKAILELVRQSSEILEKKNQEQMIAWLEKQGKNNMGISEATKKKLEDNLNKALEKETPESFNKFLDEQGEQKPADKVEPKFKIGDKVHLINGSSPNYEDDCIVISDISNNTYYGNWEGGYFAIKDQDKYELVEQKPAWSEEDEKMYNAILRDVRNGEPLDKLQYDWLKSLKDRVQPQPKQEWSEEDILHYMNVLEALEYVKGCKSDYDKIEAAKSDIAWFKSLRPQNRWKPSDEQIEALDFAADCVVPAEFCYKRRTLKELLEQLKKLREE